jgi:hypothetical protein
MEILTLRQPSSLKSTQGDIQVNQSHHSFSLEPADSFVNPEGHKGPIAPGSYDIEIVTPSVEFQNRFKPPLTEVLEFQNVPNRQAVYNHPGNTAADTDSCTLNGFETAPDFVGNSRPACADLLSKVKAAKANREKVTWTIRYA